MKPDQVFFGLTAGPKLRSAEGAAGEVGRDIGRPDHREHPQEADEPEIGVLAHHGRHQHDDQPHRGSRSTAQTLPAGPRARREQPPPGRRSPTREEEARSRHQHEENASATARPIAEDGLHQPARARRASSGPFDHDGDAGSEPEQREGPAAEIGGQREQAAISTMADSNPRVVSSLRWRPAIGLRGQGRALVCGHRQPARALRPPKRRSRRQYSSIAALKVASSKSGQKSGQEDELGIGRLPGQEVRDPLLARGADDEVGIRDAVGVESGSRRYRMSMAAGSRRPGLHLLGKGPHGARRFPAGRHS